MVIATLMSDAATAFGLMAAAIAVCSFMAHIRPAFSGDNEQRIRKMTVVGGVGGIALALFVIVLSAWTS